jgi:hypothetical protein
MATPPTFTSGAVLTAAQMNSVGLWLVKTQVVGSAVSSVAVTSAFSADYDSYRIIYSGGSQSSAGEMRMTLGATGGVVYYSSIIYATWAGATGGTGGNGIAYWNVGSGRPAGNSVCIDIHRPNNTDETWFNGSYVGIDAGSVGGSANGFLNNTTSYTGFTFTPSAGTLTGGTIYVYGYKGTV